MYDEYIKKEFEYREKNSQIVILGDSIEVMKNMESKSIDLIFAAKCKCNLATR